MTRTLDTTPAADEFYMPAEFEAHSGCWMLWPERPSNWRLGAKPAQKAFSAVARAIATAEPVTIGASRTQYLQARSMLPDAVRVVEMSSDDAWMRDVGPTFVINKRGELRGVDWVFNAWGGIGGGLYFPWDQDDLVARKVLELEAGPLFHLFLGFFCFWIAAQLQPGLIQGFLAASAILQLQSFLISLYPFWFLEMDGYHILVELVGVPTLNNDSVRFVRESLWRRIRSATWLTRQEAICLTYFTLSLASVAGFVLLNVWLLTAAGKS